MSVNPKDEVLWISTVCRCELVEWARIAVPDEACGLLLGVAAEVRRIAEVVRIENLRTAGGAARFELDPAAWVLAEDAARARGLEPLGFWHSHPSGALEPSRADAAGAWEGSLHLIVEPGGGLAAYRSQAGQLVRIELAGLEAQGPPWAASSTTSEPDSA